MSAFNSIRVPAGDLLTLLPIEIGYSLADRAAWVLVSDSGQLTGAACAPHRSLAELGADELRAMMRYSVSAAPVPGASVGLLALHTPDDDAAEALTASISADALVPQAAPSLVTQVTDGHWRPLPAGQWIPLDPASPATVAAVVAGRSLAVAASRDEMLAIWHHDDQRCAALAEQVASHTWQASTLEDRQAILDGVLTRLDTAELIAALSGPYWLRDSLALTLAQRDWHSIRPALAAAVAAAEPSRVAAVASSAALTAFTVGRETDGLRCLERAEAADAEHSLTRLLVKARDLGMPMTLTVRGTVTDHLSVSETLSVGLPGSG